MGENQSAPARGAARTKETKSDHGKPSFPTLIFEHSTGVVILAIIIGLGGILLTAWRAARGSGLQIVATPITGVLLLAVLASVTSKAPIEVMPQMLLISVAMGVPIMAILLPGRDPRLLMAVGVIVGWIGVVLATSAINSHVPGFSLFLPLDQIQGLDPFHIGFFRQPSDAELAERIRHNAGTEAASWLTHWPLALFVLQTVVVAAWDTLLLGAGVLIVGVAASIPIRAVNRLLGRPQ